MFDVASEYVSRPLRRMRRAAVTTESKRPQGGPNAWQNSPHCRGRVAVLQQARIPRCSACASTRRRDHQAPRTCRCGSRVDAAVRASSTPPPGPASSVGFHLARPRRIHARSSSARYLVPSASRSATHSLSVQASITIRARPSPARRRSARLGPMRRSMISPPSRGCRSAFPFCTSMPICPCCLSSLPYRIALSLSTTHGQTLHPVYFSDSPGGDSQRLRVTIAGPRGNRPGRPDAPVFVGWIFHSAPGPLRLRVRRFPSVCPSAWFEDA